MSTVTLSQATMIVTAMYEIFISVQGFLALPQDVIIEILDYLDVRDLMDFAETVPKIQLLIYHPKLWRTIDLHRVFVISDELIWLLERNAKQVQIVYANNPNLFFKNKEAFQSVMCLMSNVTYLDLSMCNNVEDMQFSGLHAQVATCCV